MSKIHLKRLEEKYGTDKITGPKYQHLMTQIIASNSENISRAVLRLQDDKFRTSSPVKSRALSLPDITDVLPKRSVFTRKAADRGKMMTDNLRDQLTKNLRDVLNRPDYIRRRGSLTGTLKDSVIKDFEKSIKTTFENYTKGYIPANVKTIAVTEVRSTVNNIKDEYMSELRKKNDDLIMTKVWKHNGKLVKQARMHHREMNGVEIDYEKEFVMFNKKSGQVVKCMYPHQAGLPPEEVIGCQCEVVYKFEKRVK